MGRCAVTQGVEQKTELGALLFFADAECLKHACLHIGLVDTHRATADFPTVERQVVGLGKALGGIGVHQLVVAVFRRSEGVVACRPALAFLVVFEHREIDHPKRSPGRAIDVALLVADLAAQCAERVIDDLGLVGAEEDQVAGLGAGALHDRLQGLLVQVFDDRRLQAFLV